MAHYEVVGSKGKGGCDYQAADSLSDAKARADDQNMRLLPEYVAYFYNNAPIGCWGSKRNVQAWLAVREEVTR